MAKEVLGKGITKFNGSGFSVEVRNYATPNGTWAGGSHRWIAIETSGRVNSGSGEDMGQGHYQGYEPDFVVHGKDSVTGPDHVSNGQRDVAESHKDVRAEVCIE